MISYTVSFCINLNGWSGNMPEKIINKIWELEGYRLQQKIYKKNKKKEKKETKTETCLCESRW